MYQCFKKIFVLFCPAGDKMFSSSHYVPDGTLVSGGILLSTNMLSLAGRKTTSFRTDFSKKTNITFLHPTWGIDKSTSDNHFLFMR